MTAPALARARELLALARNPGVEYVAMEAETALALLAVLDETMGENETPSGTRCGVGIAGAIHWSGCECHEAEWKRKLDEAEAENAEVHLRFARLLDRLTDGRMSKTNYSVEVMEQEIDATYERWHEQDRRDALLAEKPKAALLPLEAPECNDGDDCCRYCGRGLQPCGACKPVASPPDVREAAEEGRVVVTATRRVGDKDTMSFDGTTFTTVRTCCDCGVLICGGPTRCLYCAAKLPTSAPGAECTGIAASWCPVHGNCSCPRDEEGARTENRSGVDCPLHGLASNHGDAEDSALAARRGDV